MKTVTKTLSATLPSDLFTVPLEQVLFFDIETTGLSPKASSLYLIGTAFYDSDTEQFRLTQWFADSSSSEKEILTSFLAQAEDFHCLCHFNGRTFDIPYVMQKCQKYELSLTAHCQALLAGQSETASVDLLVMLRPLKKLLTLSHGTQKDWERWLGIQREDKYNGGELIQVYSQYRQDLILHPEEAVAKESLLLLHNHDDIAGMLSVATLLAYRRLLMRKGEAPAAISEVKTERIDTTENRLYLSFRLPVPVPREISVTAGYSLAGADSKKRQDAQRILPDCTLRLVGDTGRLGIPICQGRLKYFIPDYKNYYYLPAEDTAVHRSVAEFVDKEHRRKATAATCFLPQDGRFIPTLTPLPPSEDVQAFRIEYKDRQCFYALPEEDSEELMKWLTDYVKAQLGGFLS